ncbi:MAG: UPF0280 family protein, partial [Deltaproteobacteria bacterium]|nr:UPF0280 family protein [Deltaproteobacteria bacterium]
RDPLTYRERSYRHKVQLDDLVSSHMRIQETDLHIRADRDVTLRASDLVFQYRLQLEEYIAKTPVFSSSLAPLPMDNLAPAIVQDMLGAAEGAGVGPMAAVAGSMAYFVGKSLVEEGVAEIIVENGGDIYLNRKKECTVAIYAGASPLSYKVGVRIFPQQMPCGICTSSGTIGHSLSLGKADSVTVLADSVALADAAATRLGNEVGTLAGGKDGIQNALKEAENIDGIRGVIVICNDILGAYGDINLVKLD